MNSIVERLRDRRYGDIFAMRHEAAELIESQERRIKELERENSQAKEAIATLNAGKPLGEIVGLHTAQNALARVKELEQQSKLNAQLAQDSLKVAEIAQAQLAALRQRIDDAPVVAWETLEGTILIDGFVRDTDIPLIRKEDI